MNNELKGMYKEEAES